MMKYSWKTRSFVILSFVIFITVWQCFAVIINNDIYIPGIDQILIEVKRIMEDENFFRIILSSFFRSSLSYILSLCIAIIFGVLSVMYPFFEYLMIPFNSLAKTIPTMVLVVIALVWFDKNFAPFVVGTAITFPILYEGIRNNIKNMDNKIIEMMKIYEVTYMDKILKIYIPIIKFYFISIFVSTFSLTFKVVIAGEVHGQPKYGIGSAVQIEKINFNTSGIFAWIIIIAFISIVLEIVNKLINKKLYRWQNESRN